MTSTKQKLELTWIGKGKDPVLEPRILIEDPGKSYGDPNSENILIHGDNLLALKALEQDYVGKIKCIYIDPPYNINATGVPYDDFKEHSLWLNLMKSRLQILYKLLANDGLMAIQIDDYEYAKLYLLLSEIFHSEKNLKTIVIKMSEASGKKMAAAKKYGMVPKIKEYIILGKKNGVRDLNIELIPKGKWDSEYNIFLEGFSIDDKKEIDEMSLKDSISEDDIEFLDKIAQKITLRSLVDIAKENNISIKDREKWYFDNSYRICQCAASESIQKLAEEKKTNCEMKVFFVRSRRGENAYMVRSGWSENSKKPRVQLIFAEDNLSVHPGDLWTDIRTTGIDMEGGVKFKNSKKPEALLKRIISMCSKTDDYVLDSFLGSGTTTAVAHKMGRKWIGIELGEHINSHCIPRLKSVIDGSDQSGISKITNWKGGGGFKFYELASSLLNKDGHGNWVISEEYDANRLAAAMAKHNNFKYQPDQTFYWKQGQSTEKDFIFTTTNFITAEFLDKIHEEMQPGDSLLICCKSYQEACENRHSNISIKKIPQMILGKCEFGREDYSLNIINIPTVEDESGRDIQPEEDSDDTIQPKSEVNQLNLIN